jgi:TolB-like protein
MKSCLQSLCVFLLLAVVPAAAAEPPARPALAVLTFDSSLAESEAADLVAAGLADRFPVVERRELDKVLAEHELNLKGLVSPDQAIQAGKLVGARFLLAGRVFPLGNHVSVSVRVISVDTGRFKGLSFFLPGEPGLAELSRHTVAELTRKLPQLEDDLRAPADESKPSAAARPPATGPLIAVLNYANLGEGDPEWDWLGKGLADLTIGGLAGQDVRVVSREQMQELVHELEVKKANREPREVAGVLRAAGCVHGTYRVAGGRVELHASLLRVNDGKQVHAAAVSGPAEKLLDLHQKLVAELADVLKGRRPGTLDPAKLPRWTESLRASQLLYRGIDRFDQGQYLEAWGLFRRALRQDARYADARYWSGRMMYYLLEYHQARVDLEAFAIDHPRHPRAGDAVMEVINAAQHTAANADEMLDVLRFAAQLAPRAEVPNQFGTGGSSTVALYTAGLAAQILAAQRRYREAFDRYAEAADTLPADHPLYWVAWHEMFPLRLKHLQGTGELLPMPPRPRNAAFLGALRERGRPGHWSPGVRVVPESMVANAPGPPLRYEGGGDVTDNPVDRDFVPLTPERPSHEWDLSADPLVPCVHPEGRPETVLAEVSTGTHYLTSDPQHYLAGLDLEVRYRPDPNTRFLVNGAALDNSGVFRQSFPLLPPSRLYALSLRVTPAGEPHMRPGTTTLAVLSWKVTARFRPGGSPSGTLVFRTPPDLPFDINVDSWRSLSTRTDTVAVEDLPPGSYQVSASPQITGKNKAAVTTVDVAPGETVEVALSARVDPRRKAGGRIAWPPRRISTPYEVFRMGAGLGGRDGDVCFFEDRAGRRIVVWSPRHNLYLCLSADRGRTWSPTWQLPVPVNSAHDQSRPCLSQDAEGRYLLAFTSDRNLAHAHKVYVCWSEDLVNFSAPVLVSPDPGDSPRLLQRADGTYLAYYFTLGLGSTPDQHNFHLRGGDSWAVCTSTDLVRWSRPERALPPSSALAVVEDHGRYLALTEARSLKMPQDERLTDFEERVAEMYGCFRVWTSADGIHFTDHREIPLDSADPATGQGAPTASPAGGDARLRGVAGSAPGRGAAAGIYPAQIVCRRSGDQMLLFLGSQTSQGLALASSDGREWRRVAELNGYQSGGAVFGGDMGWAAHEGTPA